MFRVPLNPPAPGGAAKETFLWRFESQFHQELQARPSLIQKLLSEVQGSQCLKPGVEWLSQEVYFVPGQRPRGRSGSAESSQSLWKWPATCLTLKESQVARVGFPLCPWPGESSGGNGSDEVPLRRLPIKTICRFSSSRHIGCKDNVGIFSQPRARKIRRRRAGENLIE